MGQGATAAASGYDQTDPPGTLAPPFGDPGATAAPSDNDGQPDPSGQVAVTDAAPSNTVTIGTAGGLQFELTFAATDQNVPAADGGQSGFESAVEAAAQTLANDFSDPITLVIDVGWGELGVADPSRVPGADGESLGNDTAYTYSQIANALAADATSPTDRIAVAHLAGDPGAGGRDFEIPNADAKALGLAIDPSPDGFDGYIGFGTQINPQDASFIGVAEHELSEVMGRVGITDDAGGGFTVLDLFRYYAGPPIQPEPDSATGPNGQGTTYFSIDGGSTVVDTFSNVQGDDAGADWKIGNPPDAFNAEYTAGQAQPLSAGDIEVMDALGYNLSGAALSPARVAATVANPSTGDLGTGSSVTVTVTMTAAVTISGGIPTLSLNDTGTATYNSAASTPTALVFDYTVAAGQNTSALAITGVDLNGAAITDSGGNAADLSGADVTFNGLQVGPAVAETAPPDDFNGDGLSDVLWHNGASGDTGYWLTDTGGAVVGFHDFADGSTTYSIAGVGDFNDDGAPDILWHDASTGDTGYWLTNSSGAVTGFHDFGDGSTAYSIAGIGDFNDDGTSDVLWHDAATGDTGYWQTNFSGTVTGFHDFGNGNTAYSIAGVADFTGDGTSDILWHDSSTGDTGYWLTNSVGAVTGFDDLGSENASYAVAGIGDFNGDGTPDILWHDSATGDTGYWAINSGGQVAGFHDFGAGDTAYAVAAVGDYNGDGTSDVLWHDSTTGDTGYWLTNSSGAVTGFHDYAAGTTSYAVEPG